MKEVRKITVEGIPYSVVISDEQETLLAARAAGRVPVGLWGNSSGDLRAAHYLIETMETADERFLERVVRRELGLPWTIGESERLLIREFVMEDLKCVVPEEGDRASDRIFYTPDQLEAYIREQYGFYEYGVWAIVRKEDGALIGKAGIVGWEGFEKKDNEENGLQMELGYHIFRPYRRCGYAEEACRIILDYIREEYDCPVYAVTLRSNQASRNLLEKLGFRPEDSKSGDFKTVDQKYSGSEPLHCRYVRNY